MNNKAQKIRSTNVLGKTVNKGKKVKNAYLVKIKNNERLDAWGSAIRIASEFDPEPNDTIFKLQSGSDFSAKFLNITYEAQLSSWSTGIYEVTAKTVFNAVTQQESKFLQEIISCNEDNYLTENKLNFNLQSPLNNIDLSQSAFLMWWSIDSPTVVTNCMFSAELSMIITVSPEYIKSINTTSDSYTKINISVQKL